MLVVGPKEAESGAVNVRIRGGKENETMGIESFLRIAAKKIVDKTADLALNS
jgi:threonyl-tRNA synthetase